MKIDQIAFLARTDEDEHLIKYRLGLLDAEWIEDVVVAQGIVNGELGKNTAKLLFNEDLGIQVEILRYTDGPNYTQHLKAGEICHIGIHATFDEPLPPFAVGAKEVQEVETISHTNPFLIETGRRYAYAVYDTRKTFGVHFKVIRRITEDDYIYQDDTRRVLKDIPQA